MAKFAILVSKVSGHTFVKDYDFFVSQGGTRDEWGKNWEIVEAPTLEAARVIAIKRPGAVPGLHCPKCGHDAASRHCCRWA
jgi:hypothetical protein